eukprot:scaffold7378_cov410-Prasinococcus_capsulatus_cf.AAC.18
MYHGGLGPGQMATSAILIARSLARVISLGSYPVHRKYSTGGLPSCSSRSRPALGAPSHHTCPGQCICATNPSSVTCAVGRPTHPWVRSSAACHLRSPLARGGKLRCGSMLSLMMCGRRGDRHPRATGAHRLRSRHPHQVMGAPGAARCLPSWLPCAVERSKGWTELCDRSRTRALQSWADRHPHGCSGHGTNCPMDATGFLVLALLCHAPGALIQRQPP